MGEHTSLGISVYWLGGTHITRDMCFLGRGRNSPRDVCFLGRVTHIYRDMCFPGRGTQITRDVLVLLIFAIGNKTGRKAY